MEICVVCVVVVNFSLQVNSQPSFPRGQAPKQGKLKQGKHRGPTHLHRSGSHSLPKRILSGLESRVRGVGSHC